MGTWWESFLTEVYSTNWFGLLIVFGLFEIYSAFFPDVKFIKDLEPFNLNEESYKSVMGLRKLLVLLTGIFAILVGAINIMSLSIPYFLACLLGYLSLKSLTFKNIDKYINNIVAINNEDE